MFGKGFNRSIRFKFLSVVVVALIIGTIVLSFAIATNESDLLMRSMVAKGHDLGSYIAGLSLQPMLMKDSVRLDSLVNNAIHDEATQNDNILYIMIQDEQGRILTSLYSSINYRSPILKRILSGLPQESELQNVISYLKKQKAVMETSAPITTGYHKIGKVTVGMSLQAIHKQIVKTVLLIIVLNMLGALVIGAAIFLVSKKIILRPIAELASAASRFAKGDLTTRVKAKTTGEMQMLVNGFNRMAEDLNQSTVSKNYVENIIKSMMNTLMVVSSDGRIIKTNDATTALLGYEKDELLGQPIEAAIKGGLWQAGSDLQEIFPGGFIGNVEKTYMTKDGRGIPVLLSASVMRDNDNAIQGIVCAAQDITDRKNAEQQMRLFLDLVNQSNDALTVWDLHTGRISLINEKSCRDLQYSEAELLGMRPEEISAKPEGFFECLFKKLRETGTWLGEDVHRRKDGTTFPVEVNVKYTVVNDREFAVAVARDISERRELEAEMFRARKLESLGVLAGGIAHDFNNLLTGIQGNVSLAQNLLDAKDEAVELLTEANAAATQARNLTKQLLTFAKGGEPVKKVLSLPELLTDTARFTLRGSNVRCEFHIAGDLRPVSGDEGQLRQVIQNLVLNADQAMPEGGVIRITAENEELLSGSPLPLEAGLYVRIRVQDQGIGILPQHLSKIFDPYFSAKKKGSGLGLASVYSVIKKHSGTVTVNSEVGKGSVFTVRLPAADSPATDSGWEKPETIRRGRGRILVMDDEEHVQRIAVRILTRLGYQAESVGDGREALERYRQARKEGTPFAAVLMDLTIPGGMGGKQTIVELQKLDPQVRAIVSSGYTNDDLMANYQAYGFRGVVPKPYDLTELSQVLSEVLGAAGEERPAPVTAGFSVDRSGLQWG